MSPSEKLKTLIDILASKAILSQGAKFNLLLRDVQHKMEIADAVTILSRLQSDKIVDTLSIFQAENVGPGGLSFRVMGTILGPHFDLDHIDRNLLSTDHVLKMVLFPPFIRTAEDAGVEKQTIDLLSPLFSVPAHPDVVDIYCPIHRCTAGKVTDEKEWLQLTKGATFKCKDRRHDILATWHNGRIALSLLCDDKEENTEQT